MLLERIYAASREQFLLPEQSIFWWHGVGSIRAIAQFLSANQIDIPAIYFRMHGTTTAWTAFYTAYNQFIFTDINRHFFCHVFQSKSIAGAHRQVLCLLHGLCKVFCPVGTQINGRFSNGIQTSEITFSSRICVGFQDPIFQTCLLWCSYTTTHK